MHRIIILAALALLLTGCQSIIGKEVAVIRVVEYSGGWYSFVGMKGVAVHQSNPEQMAARVQIQYVNEGTQVVVDTGVE